MFQCTTRHYLQAVSLVLTVSCLAVSGTVSVEVPRIDPLRFLAGCRRRRLNQGLVVALGFFSLLDRACFCVIFPVYGCMLCLVRYLFVISTSVIDCLGRFVPQMTYYVTSGTLHLTKPNQTSDIRHKMHYNTGERVVIPCVIPL